MRITGYNSKLDGHIAFSSFKRLLTQLHLETSTMDTKGAIRASMDLSEVVFKGYLDDLQDSELLLSPGEGCNCLAWQVGHLIASEVSLLDTVCPGKGAELPEGFADAHSKDAAASGDTSKFLSLADYMSLFDTVRESTVAALEGLSDTDLDAETPEHFRSFCPTAGHLFTLIGTHPMMHAGQFVPVRRQLGKPVKF